MSHHLRLIFKTPTNALAPILFIIFGLQIFVLYFSLQLVFDSLLSGVGPLHIFRLAPGDIFSLGKKWPAAPILGPNAFNESENEDYEKWPEKEVESTQQSTFSDHIEVLVFNIFPFACDKVASADPKGFIAHPQLWENHHRNQVKCKVCRNEKRLYGIEALYLPF